MNQTTNRISTKAGLSPGTLIHIGKKSSEKTIISVIDYDATHYNEIICESTNECIPFKSTPSVSWINIDGLHNTNIIEEIGKQFQLHPLLLEDVLNTRHRPKVEEFDNNIFITLKMLGISKTGKNIVSEQVSIVLGDTWVISFQEQRGDIFDALRLRMKENKGTIRQQGADYLLYRLIDTVVDNYYFVTEHISERIEELEEMVLKSSERESLLQIQKLKREILNLRKLILPLREAVSELQQDQTKLIKATTVRYLRDVYEHIIHVNDSLDTQRDMLASIMDLYLSGVSNKMNQVMQVLTIIATIFIPLTFIAGIYGMNFDNMPELHWKYGYFGIWGIMIAVIIVMIAFFKRKGWL
jgi:magnesium transporter